MTFLLPSFLRRRPAVLACGVLLLAGGTGCTLFRNAGTGARMDRTESRRPAVDDRKRVMVVVVTTDAQGQVANITFKRSSGKEGVDAYAAELIRENVASAAAGGQPLQPLMRTEAEITYTREGGFSAPKVLSSAPIR